MLINITLLGLGATLHLDSSLSGTENSSRAKVSKNLISSRDLSITLRAMPRQGKKGATVAFT